MMQLNLIRDRKICTSCGTLRLKSDFGRAKYGLSSHCRPCTAARLEAHRRANLATYSRMRAGYIKDRRDEAVHALGGKCSTCGFGDHGAAERRRLNPSMRSNGKSGFNRYAFFRRVIASTDGRYQLLCANCNMIKEYERRKLALPVASGSN